MRRTLIHPLILCVTFIGCDRSPDSKPINTRRPIISIRSLAQASANQPTQLGSLSHGQAVILQPGVRKDPLSILSERGVEPWLISRSAEGKFSNNTPPTVKSMAVLPSGEVILFALDAAQSRPLIAISTPQQEGSDLRVLASPDAIALDSGLGRTIDIAEGQLAITGQDVWLCLRNPDEAAFLRVDSRELRNSATPHFARAFKQLIDDGGFAFRMLGTDIIYGDADGALCLLRPTTGESWRIDLNGTMHPLSVDASYSPSPIQPLRLPAERYGGRKLQIEFHPDESMPVALEDATAPRYPLFIIRGGTQNIVIDRNAIQIRAAFPTHALRITAWCVDSASGDIIAYDEMSGEIFRLVLSGI